jgi:hypothetical protein
MSNSSSRSSQRAATLTIKIGRLLEAHATGWAVCTVPIVLILVFAAGLAMLALR